MPWTWNAATFTKTVLNNSLDGVEEWCNAKWLPQAVQDCPVDTGVMQGSLGVERNDTEQVCYVGGGGAAEDYIMKQELDRSLHHNVGKAGFIVDTVNDNISELKNYVQKHL